MERALIQRKARAPSNLIQTNPGQRHRRIWTDRTIPEKRRSPELGMDHQKNQVMIVKKESRTNRNAQPRSKTNPKTTPSPRLEVRTKKTRMTTRNRRRAPRSRIDRTVAARKPARKQV